MTTFYDIIGFVSFLTLIGCVELFMTFELTCRRCGRQSGNHDLADLFKIGAMLLVGKRDHDCKPKPLLVERSDSDAKPRSD
jgi:hypothetical protein